MELEIQAQGNSHKLKKETFAAVVDLHARQIPQGTTNGEYRPGALGLEVPTTMAGPQEGSGPLLVQPCHNRT